MCRAYFYQYPNIPKNAERQQDLKREISEFHALPEGQYVYNNRSTDITYRSCLVSFHS